MFKKDGRSLYWRLVGHPSRVSYWSNSKVAKVIRCWFGMNKKPIAATMEEWYTFKKENKLRSKIGYWITEELLNSIQSAVYFPYDVYRNIRRYIRNRYFDKLHYLPTKLEPGQYYDIDTRLLHGVFETLVDFVETEKAGMYSWRKDEDDYVPLSPREAGLAHLDWEISLTYDEGMGLKKDDPDYGKPTSQAECAKETKELYLWWKDVYPNRPEPMDESGWSEYCDSKESIWAQEKDEEERKRVREMLDECHRLEEAQHDEDTEMLIRVIKIRRGLWT